ncbi:MAG: hypothetical protein JNK60_08635 [Acidobacteria bacterium]|nr:hypothetical protein [Acidobacteriota bacterium]
MATLVLSSALFADAAPGQAMASAPPPTAVPAASVRLPETPAEHLAMSEEYTRKAATYREEAAFHRKMLADYKAQVRPDPRHAFENTYVKKMRIHCEGYIKNADALATDAEKFAEYHRLRAGELTGQ